MLLWNNRVSGHGQRVKKKEETLLDWGLLGTEFSAILNSHCVYILCQLKTDRNVCLWRK